MDHDRSAARAVVATLVIVGAAGGGCATASASATATVVQVHAGAAEARGVDARAVAGRWSSEFESPTGLHATALTFVPDGDALRGYYVGSHNEPGVLVGSMRGNVMEGRWLQAGREGPFRFAFTSARSFVGAWEFPDAPGGRWEGARSPEP